LTKLKLSEGELKINVTRLRKESITTTDNLAKLQNDLIRLEKEKKEGIQKIQTMHQVRLSSLFYNFKHKKGKISIQEIRDLKNKLEEFEANKAVEIRKLEDSLTETLKSNKKAQVSFTSLIQF